ITNNHVIEGAKQEGALRAVSVEYGKLNDDGTMTKVEDKLEGFVQKADKNHDLALVELKKMPTALHAVKLAAKNPMPGERVASIGNPGMGMAFTVRWGYVSGIGHAADFMATPKFVIDRFFPDPKALYVQSTVGISPGDSGGALVNESGDLVGLNFAG